MDNLPASLSENEEGKPQILIYDSSKPLCGFSSIGFAYDDILNRLTEGQELKDGDVVALNIGNQVQEGQKVDARMIEADGSSGKPKAEKVAIAQEKRERRSSCRAATPWR